MGCFFSLYCVLTPILDEMTISVELLSVENGVWRKALVINSRVFAAAHFSREDMVQLFGIGYVLAKGVLQLVSVGGGACTPHSSFHYVLSCHHSPR